MEISAQSIVTVPTRKAGKCASNTPCIYEIEINDIIGVQNSQLVMLPMVHLKDNLN